MNIIKHNDSQFSINYIRAHFVDAQGNAKFTIDSSLQKKLVSDLCLSSILFSKKDGPWKRKERWACVNLATKFVAYNETLLSRPSEYGLVKAHEKLQKQIDAFRIIIPISRISIELLNNPAYPRIPG